MTDRGDLWTDVDRYLSELLVPPDAALDAALMTSAQAGLPPINVAPNQGKMLELLARATRAGRILEVGTLGGYSTIWLGRALSHGDKLITLELQQDYAEIAVANIARAGLSDIIEVRVGPAADSLRSMIDAEEEPFDLVFIDADKSGYPEYFELSLELSRPGTLIIADNVVRDGAVIDPDTTDANVQGVREFLEVVSKEPRVDATAIQTVGSKGYDGFALLLVTS
jgi:predicted O-methyltransferase YrrM